MKNLKPQRPISDPKTAHSGVVGTFYRTPGFPGGVKSFLVVIDSPHSLTFSKAIWSVGMFGADLR